MVNLLEMSDEDLINSLKRGELTVAIYGMGYVGTAIAAVWARAGAKVIGVDADQRKVAAFKSCTFKLSDSTVEAELRRLSKSFSYTMNGEEASANSQVKIVTVPIYIRDGEPRFEAFLSAMEGIGKGLKRGDLVIIESSVPPRTTVDIAKPALERASGLTAEDDFGLVYSPERIYVGRAIQDIEERYPKVIGGVGPRSARVAKALYGVIARKGVLEVSSPTVAETEKLVEGVYRDVNIALANEVARLCRSLGIDFDEVRDAANSQPYSHLHKPGPGVGGSCIPVYPQFLLYAAKRIGAQLDLTALGRQINVMSAKYVFDLIREAAGLVGEANPRVSVLGLAFRGDVDDTRLSPSYDVIKHLVNNGFKQLLVHDPFVEQDDVLRELGIPLTKDLDAALRADVIAILTDHSEYFKLSLDDIGKRNARAAVVDARHVIRNWRNPPRNVIYMGIGRPTVGGIHER
ncbi:UDP-N-acetyl-D-mannosaminuronic acid dehydrogenase [Thermocladium modestius]|uniref:UDP-N-acetyl-D-mannosamine dehydrogenase n=1 Tax=Thermocladium modestius TaxID=62609 RepID=A0A830GTY3_9CREN|nr:nucleotide sugar dehydrogenase [Thermocladium modestius]GGP19410.1 UDP-N-acetyl-D-mannosaminuronic acid dehydrogenase [Thermocladium modestius]